MQYQIDQSGKIEHTSKTTIIAYANGRVNSLKISAKEKQKLIQMIKELNRPKTTYIYTIFAVLIFILLTSSRNRYDITEIIIDKEYPGKDATIKNTILQLYTVSKMRPPYIRFHEIGRKNMAHKTALCVFQGKQKPDLIVNAMDVFKYFL